MQGRGAKVWGLNVHMMYYFETGFSTIGFAGQTACDLLQSNILDHVGIVKIWWSIQTIISFEVVIAYMFDLAKYNSGFALLKTCFYKQQGWAAIQVEANSF